MLPRHSARNKLISPDPGHKWARHRALLARDERFKEMMESRGFHSCCFSVLIHIHLYIHADDVCIRIYICMLMLVTDHGVTEDNVMKRLL